MGEGQLDVFNRTTMDRVVRYAFIKSVTFVLASIALLCNTLLVFKRV
jgi:hypothetical protein